MTHEAQIIACEHRLLQAIQTGDLAALDELLHEKVLFNPPSGPPVTKAQDLAEHRSGKLRVETLAASEQRISLLDDAAVVSVVIDLQGTYAGQPLSGKFRYLRVWKLCGEGWRVIAASCNQYVP